MKIVRSTIVAEFEDITTNTAHEFMKGIAEREAQQIGGMTVTTNGQLSGRSTIDVVNDNGDLIARFHQEWPQATD